VNGGQAGSEPWVIFKHSPAHN